MEARTARENESFECADMCIAQDGRGCFAQDEGLADFGERIARAGHANDRVGTQVCRPSCCPLGSLGPSLVMGISDGIHSN